VEEVPWRPERAARKGAETVGVRVDVQEVSLQRQVKLAGGRWNPARRVWELRRDQALKLGLKDRIENAKVWPVSSAPKSSEQFGWPDSRSIEKRV